MSLLLVQSWEFPVPRRGIVVVEPASVMWITRTDLIYFSGRVQYKTGSKQMMTKRNKSLGQKKSVGASVKISKQNVLLFVGFEAIKKGGNVLNYIVGVCTYDCSMSVYLSGFCRLFLWCVIWFQDSCFTSYAKGKTIPFLSGRILPVQGRCIHRWVVTKLYLFAANVKVRAFINYSLMKSQLTVNSLRTQS